MSDFGPALFFVAAGYINFQLCYLTKHRASALPWERNLWEATIIGAGLLLLTRILIWMVDSTIGDLTLVVSVRRFMQAAIPFPYIGSYILALLIGGFFALGINWRIPREDAIRWVVHRYGGELLRLLHHAAEQGVPVSISMENRKFYIGLIEVPPGPRYPYVRILPTLSGYRDETSLQFVFTTDYRSALIASAADSNLEPSDMAVVLPMDRVISANLFDDDTYQGHFRHIEANRPPEMEPVLVDEHGGSA